MYRKSQHRQAQLFSRVILPLILFLAMVGTIAWVTQYMPSIQRPRTADNTNNNKKDEGPQAPTLIKLQRETPQWDPQDPYYVKEFEAGVEAHYDYPFENVSGRALQVGLQFSNCSCQRIEIAALSPEDWKQYQAESSASTLKLPFEKVERSETKGVSLPAGYHGVARVNWKTKSMEGQTDRLLFKLWAHGEGQAEPRQFVDTMTPVKVVAPLMYMPDTLKLGAIIGQSSGHLLCWSATREDPKLVVDQSRLHPCFSFKIEPLPKETRLAIQEKWRGDKDNPRNTRILSAFRINVTVAEEKGGKYLDQGHFRQSIPLKLDDKEVAGPLVTGAVRGDLVVGSTDDDGKIQLKSFSGTSGIKRTVVISADPKTELKIESTVPQFLKARLEVNKKDSSDARSVWNLFVEVPPSSHFGPLPENSVIILRSQGAQGRLIRIPVLGNAGQG